MGNGNLAISLKASPIHNEVGDGIKRTKFCSIFGTHLIERNLRLCESHPFGFLCFRRRPLIMQIGFEKGRLFLGQQLRAVKRHQTPTELTQPSV